MTRQRRYYDPGADPRPRNPTKMRTGAPLKPRVPHTPADVARKEAAAAKRVRRAAQRTTTKDTIDE